MMERLIQKIFHAICYGDYHANHNYMDIFQKGLEDIEEFFNVRFEARIDFEGKTILDMGCGYGSAVIYAFQKGAKEVIGIDKAETTISFGNFLLNNEYKHLSNVAKFIRDDEIGGYLDNEKFDIILSKDSFEHYDDPAKMIANMKKKLKKNGVIVIGFGPLWKAPYGGHLPMTKVPWVHLIFPESIIIAELRRFYHNDEIKSIGQHVVGLNKMTLGKFLKIVEENDLEYEYFKVNLSPTRLMHLFNILRQIPFCREFFTTNIYCVLRQSSEYAGSKRKDAIPYFWHHNNFSEGKAMARSARTYLNASITCLTALFRHTYYQISTRALSASVRTVRQKKRTRTLHNKNGIRKNSLASHELYIT